MRTLKYFGVQAEKMVAFVMVMGILYGIIFGSIFSETMQERSYVMTNYILMMGIIVILVTQTNLVKLNMPLVLSLGCGRKEAFWGAQWMTALLIVQFEFICLLSNMLFSNDIQEYAGFLARILPFICIASGVLSELLAILLLKFGNKGTWIGVLCMALVWAFIGFTMNDRVKDFDRSLSALSGSFRITLFAVLLILYAFLAVIYYYVWKKYELKAF